MLIVSGLRSRTVKRTRSRNILSDSDSSCPISLHISDVNRATYAAARASGVLSSNFFFKRTLPRIARHSPRLIKSTRLKKTSWRSFSRSHNLTPNLHLAREPLILCPLKPPWSTPSTYTISLHLSSPCSRKAPLPLQHHSYLPSFLPVSQRYLCLD